jgi:hypothetical protein
VEDPSFRETVKEFAQLERRFCRRRRRDIPSAGRFVDVDLSAPATFCPASGVRRAAGASISRTTNAIAVAVSKSAVVSVFSQGEIRAEIIPSSFCSRANASRRAPRSGCLPEAGLRLTVARDQPGHSGDKV